MESEEIVIALPEGESRRMTVYHTIYGPVITDVVRHTKIVGLNFIAGDVDGNIGWHTTGAFPIRSGFSGRLPADTSSGLMNWNGLLPYEDMPGVLNPPDGSIINSNNRVVTGSDPHPISNMWSAPYRRERIGTLLEEMDNPTVEDFRKMQMDVYSLQAEEILPRVFAHSFQNEKAREAVQILKDWDRQVRADSPGAAVYEVFLTKWVRALLEDEGGGTCSVTFILPSRSI